MPNVICFGDSITRGENDHISGGWADRLKSEAIRKFLNSGDDEICVFNLGIGGETSKGLVGRFESELKPRIGIGDINLVTIAYGANDVAVIDRKYSTPIGTYIGKIGQALASAKQKK